MSGRARSWPLCACSGLLWLAVLCAGPLGCEPGLDLRYHGRQRVAVGDYRVLGMYSDAADAYALVQDRARAHELTILPFHGRACDAGEAADYVVLQRSRGLRVLLFDSNATPTAMRILDPHCNQVVETMDAVLDARMIGSKLLVSVDGGRLYAVDPWEGTSPLMAKSFTRRGSSVAAGDEVAPGGGVWLLEGDTLVLRDFEGRALRRIGHHVQEIALAADGQSMVFSDDDGLQRLGPGGDAVERLSDPGCQLRYERWVRGSTLTDVVLMLSPCDLGRFVTIAADGGRKVVADEVTSFFGRRFATDEGQVENWLVYATKAEADGGSERYFIAPPSGAALEVGVPIGKGSTLMPLGLMSGKARAWLVTTDESDTRFGVFTSGQGFLELASGVEAVMATPAGTAVLHDYASGTGTLSLLSSDGSLHALAHDVPQRGLLQFGPWPDVLSTYGVSTLAPVDAVLRDYDGSTGVLARIAASTRLQTIAHGVPLSSPASYLTLVRGSQLVDPAHDFSVLSYVHDYDSETKTGTLSVTAPDGDTLTIDTGVTSYVPSGDPDRQGLLYATGGAGAHEVWFVQQ